MQWTLKRKDTSFLNDVILFLCFSCPNVLYAILQGVFLCHVTIFSKGLNYKRLYVYFPLSTMSLFKTLIRQLLWIGILKRGVGNLLS